MRELPTEKKPIFLRDATGLVRELSIFQSFMLNFAFLGIWLSYPTYTFGPFVFPGGDMVAATVFASVFSVIFVVMYTMFGLVMPRSGGDYVFMSRTLHPTVGFMVNFALCFTFMWISGLGAEFVSNTGIAPSLALVAAMTGNQSYAGLASTFSQPLVVAAVAVVILVILGLIMVRGVRFTGRITAILMIMTFVGIAVMLGLMAVNSNADFVADFSRYGNYSQVISAAHAAGYSPVASNPLLSALGVTPLVSAGTLFGFGANYWGGEIKSLRKNLWISQVLMTSLTGLILSVLAFLMVRTFGYDFIGSISYLFNTGSSAYPLSVSLFPNVLISILTTNPVVLWTITITFIASTVGPIIGVYMVVSRAIFAWSFDRVIPAKFASVADRFHSPVYAIAAIVMFDIIVVLISSLSATIFLTLLAGGFLIQCALFSIVAIAAIVFPFRQKRIYQSSPINKNIVGVPIITILGVISLAFLLMTEYFLVSNPLYGANSPLVYEGGAVVLTTGFLIFAVSYFYRKKQGVNLMMVFQEIPPE